MDLHTYDRLDRLGEVEADGEEGGDEEDIERIMRGYGFNIGGSGINPDEEAEEARTKEDGEDGEEAKDPGDIRAAKRKRATYNDATLTGKRGISALHYLAWYQTGRGEVEGEDRKRARSMFRAKKGSEVADLENLWHLWRGWAQSAFSQATLEDMMAKNVRLGSKMTVQEALKSARENDREWARKGKASAPRTLDHVMTSTKTPAITSEPTRSSARLAALETPGAVDAAAPGGGGTNDDFFDDIDLEQLLFAVDEEETKQKEAKQPEKETDDHMEDLEALAAMEM